MLYYDAQRTFPFHRCVSLPRALEAHNSGAEAALRSAARSPCGVAHTLVRRRRARAGRPIYTTHTRSAVGGGSQRAAAVCRGGRPASPRGLQVKAGAATSGRVSRVWGPRVAMGRSVGPWETWEALLATRGRPYSFRLRTASPLIQKRGSWAKLARVECTSSPPIEKRGSWGSRRV